MLQLDSLSVPNYLVARKSWHHVPCIAPDEETNRRWWPPKELMWWPDCWAPVIQSGAGPAAVPIGRLFCGAGAPSFCGRPTIHGLATAQHAALWRFNARQQIASGPSPSGYRYSARVPPVLLACPATDSLLSFATAVHRRLRERIYARSAHQVRFTIT